ncbi:MAG: hypothetical protein M1127_03160 [Patescibacteria group bacterium]|nr:hypothetical protein [Patescibacteria group bacterium]
MDKTNNNFIESILEKAKLKNLKMKPRAYFIARAFGYVLSVVGIVVLSVFLSSFTFFGLKMQGEIWLLAGVLLAGLLLLVFAWILAEKSPFFYKRPFAVGLAVFILVVFLASWAVLATPFHQKALEWSQKNNAPVISPLYKCGCGCGCGQKNSSCGGSSKCGCVK